MAKKEPYNIKDEKTGRLIPRDELTPIQLQMINELLANGGNKSEACRKLGISRQTLYDWFDDVRWETAYRSACEKMFKSGLADAIRGVLDIAKNGAGRDKVNACKTVLELNNYLSAKVDNAENTKNDIVINIVGASSVEIDEE